MLKKPRKKVQPEAEPTDPTDMDNTTTGNTVSTIPVPEPDVPITSTASKDVIDGANNIGKRGYVLSLVGIIFVSVLLQVFHLYISTPIAPGSIVPPGVWLNKCGLVRYFTSTCDDAFLHVGKDGTITGYNSHSDVVWEMVGAACASDETTTATCIPGMQFTKDLQIIVGGKHMLQINKLLLEQALSPWPFEQEPKLKSKQLKR
jgi:hypothetical protein